MQATITSLHHSPLVRVLDFKCHSACDGRPVTECTTKPMISFTRRGSFHYRVGRRIREIHSGVVLLEKAGCEYTISHHCAIKDECTIFELQEELLREAAELAEREGQKFFFTNRVPATFVPASSALEHLHGRLLQTTQTPFNGSGMKIEQLLIALLHATNCNGQIPFRTASHGKFTDHQRESLDLAKHFITANFQRDISLSEIARHSRVSVFHFSRLFRQFTSHSPYQFLREVRLQHAALLLTHTSFPVTRICFDCGFNSLEHFIISFTRHFGRSPSKYRKIPLRFLQTEGSR